MPERRHPTKYVEKLLRKLGFYDTEKRELINVEVTRLYIIQQLKKTYGEPVPLWVIGPGGPYSWLSNFHGEVLEDNKGTGFLQPVPPRFDFDVQGARVKLLA